LVMQGDGNDCSRKRRYDDCEGAREAAHDPAMKQYRCPRCGSWHNGRLPRGKRRGFIPKGGSGVPDEEAWGLL
jgi:hypothetical protein